MGKFKEGDRVRLVDRAGDFDLDHYAIGAVFICVFDDNTDCLRYEDELGNSIYIYDHCVEILYPSPEEKYKAQLALYKEGQEALETYMSNIFEAAKEILKQEGLQTWDEEKGYIKDVQVIPEGIHVSGSPNGRNYSQMCVKMEKIINHPKFQE